MEKYGNSILVTFPLSFRKIMIFKNFLYQKLNSDFFTCCTLQKKTIQSIINRKKFSKENEYFFFVFLKEYTVCIKMSAHAQNLTVNCAYSTLMCCMHVLYLISLSITRERGLNCRLSFKKTFNGHFYKPFISR